MRKRSAAKSDGFVGAPCRGRIYQQRGAWRPRHLWAKGQVAQAFSDTAAESRRRQFLSACWPHFGIFKQIFGDVDLLH